MRAEDTRPTGTSELDTRTWETGAADDEQPLKRFLPCDATQPSPLDTPLTVERVAEARYGAARPKVLSTAQFTARSSRVPSYACPAATPATTPAAGATGAVVPTPAAVVRKAAPAPTPNAKTTLSTRLAAPVTPAKTSSACSSSAAPRRASCARCSDGARRCSRRHTAWRRRRAAQAKAHGGGLRVTNREGNGASVTLSLPAGSGAPKQPPHQDPPPP